MYGKKSDNQRLAAVNPFNNPICHHPLAQSALDKNLVESPLPSGLTVDRAVPIPEDKLPIRCCAVGLLKTGAAVVVSGSGIPGVGSCIQLYSVISAGKMQFCLHLRPTRSKLNGSLNLFNRQSSRNRLPGLQQISAGGKGLDRPQLFIQGSFAITHLYRNNNFNFHDLIAAPLTTDRITASGKA